PRRAASFWKAAPNRSDFSGFGFWVLGFGFWVLGLELVTFDQRPATLRGIMQTILLHQNWTVRAASNFDEAPPELQNREIPASVPGCIHLDLLAAHLIPDPYLSCNENLV